MADAIRVSGPVGGTDKTLSFETGKLAFQSQGAVVASIGGSIRQAILFKITLLVSKPSICIDEPANKESKG